jgi:multicomponent Na+:H+ antiporter subunit E
MTKVLRFVVLVVTWLALWSDLSVANVLSGAIVAGLVILVFDTWQQGEPTFRPLRALRFAGHFMVKLVQANVVVARTVISPRDRIHTGIVAVPVHGLPDALVTLIADAISLTPGTLVLEIRRDPTVLFVHCLDLRSVEAVRAEVRRLEILAIEAFGSQRAVAALHQEEGRSS